MKNKYDVIIVGAGIAGMTCAIYLKRGGLDVLLVDGNIPGGQLNKIADIANYPGFLNISGPELAINIYNQINNLEIDYLFEEVIEAELLGDIKKITTTNQTIYCNYLVIATGRQSRKLFSNDDRYIGKGISYCALCDGNLYKGKNVAVVGGGNSALEEMLYLSNICNSVTGILRSNKFRGDSYLVEQVKNKNNIKIVYNTNVVEYNIENGQLNSLSLDNGTKIEVDGLFISIGSVPSSDVFNITKENGFIIVDSNYMTNLKNVYACGDVIKKDVYQLTTAAAEGTIVAYNIIRKSKKNND